MVTKSGGLYRCIRCNTVWNGKELHRDPNVEFILGEPWVCPDLVCGSPVETIEEAPSPLLPQSVV